MMKLKATNPLVLFVGALAIGLAGCADDVIITEPPPPPPPPPPEAAEISIASMVDLDDGDALGESDCDEFRGGCVVSGRIGIVINFDTGGFEAAQLDLLVNGSTVDCQSFSGQGSVGVSADVQVVQCVLNTAAGIGECVGQTQFGLYPNDLYTIGAELTLQDGSSVSVTRAEPLYFGNSNIIDIVPLDIGPRVVGDDGVAYWGGPRDLSWYACPILFDSSLDDVGGICELSIRAITFGSSGLTGDGRLGFNGEDNGDLAPSESPFTYIAGYVDSDGDTYNEDEVEDHPSDDGQAIGWDFEAEACDGTNVTDAFDAIFYDNRHIDTTAPMCSDFFGDINDGHCEPVIDDMAVIVNGLYSDETATGVSGDIEMADLVDGGVGLAAEVIDTFECDETDGGGFDDECDPDPLVTVFENVLATTDLPEDDGCPEGGTTDPTAQQGCLAGNDDGDWDAFFLEAVDIADLLGNTLGDGEGDQLMIADKFEASLAFGTDFGDPEYDEDEFEPPLDDPPFIWNPDQRDPATEPIGTGPFETIMFEADDPDLASGDAGSGLEDDTCGALDAAPFANACDDTDTPPDDGNYIHGRILDAPDADNEFDPDDGDDIGDPGVLPAFDAGAGMFEMEICGALDVGICDTSTDGEYTVEYIVSDHAVKVNNVGLFENTFIIDVTPPEVTFDGITGLDDSNAAEVGLTLFGAVSDATPLEVAEIRVTVDAAGGGLAACPGALANQEDNLVEPSDNDPDEEVLVDILDILGETGGDYAVDFTAGNLFDSGATLGLVTYCFEVTADDGAARKNGDDDGVETVSIATKQFTWF